MSQDRTDPLAQAGVEPITSGMIVGLGTGRAAGRAIRALGERARRERLELTCIATSRASAELATSEGLRVVEMGSVARLDYLFDGADEMDAEMRMIKGGGGAMTREKIAAHASARRVYLLQRSKLVTRLGTGAPLPVEVLGCAVASVQRALSERGLTGQVRRSKEGNEVLTDDGNPVLDVRLPGEWDLENLDRFLNALPGVVGHGLFLTEADEALIEDGEGGRVERRKRGE